MLLIVYRLYFIFYYIHEFIIYQVYFLSIIMYIKTFADVYCRDDSTNLILIIWNTFMWNETDSQKWVNLKYRGYAQILIKYLQSTWTGGVNDDDGDDCEPAGSSGGVKVNGRARSTTGRAVKLLSFSRIDVVSPMMVSISFSSIICMSETNIIIII